MKKRVTQEQGNYEPWWSYEDTGDGSESSAAAIAELDRIHSLESHRRECDALFARAYGDLSYCGLTTPDLNKSILNSKHSSENLIRAIVSTLHNKFGKNKPVPTVITEGGTYKEQSDAEEREQWIQGVFQQDNVYDLLAQAQFHSMVICDGFVGVRDDYDVGRPVAYLIPPQEIHVDPIDGRYGTPRSVFRVGIEAKEVLAARYEDFAEEIWNSTPFSQSHWDNPEINDAGERFTTFVESWHLPSKPKATDGRYIIAVQGCTLVNEAWEDDYFPFVKVPWTPRERGYFSVGLVEDLIPPQRQMNKVRAAKDEHLRLLSSSFWSVERGANIIKSHLSNLIGRVIEYTGAPPTLQTPQPVSPDLWKSEEALRAQMYEQSGVSQQAVQNMKPAGIDSGKALRVYADQQDQRYANAYKAKEDAVVELATLYCKRAQAMYESDKDPALKVKLTKNSLITEAEWKDADLDSFRVRVLEASGLSTTLGGRIQDVVDLENLGLITDVDQKRQLLQMPDLKADSALSLAPRNLILKTLQERILKNGEPVTPEPYWPLQTCSTLGTQMLCYAELKEYPEQKLQLLRNWVDECATRMRMAQPQQEAPTMPQPLPGADAGMPIPAGPTAGLPVPEGPIPGAP